MTLTQYIQTVDNTDLFEIIANDILSKGYSIRPYSLPEYLSNQLCDHIETMPPSHFKKAGIGRKNEHTVNNFIRSDEICWITGEHNAGKSWLNWAESLQVFLNRRLFLGLFSFESHFAHYAKGDFYKKHKDAFKGEDNRVLSLVVYLNNAWWIEDGGELVIYKSKTQHAQLFKGESIKVTPGLGTIVVFLSEEFPHEVLPAKRDRYSIAGWFRLNNNISNNIDPPN
ncbi:MAG: 2OG-Fe(II) oxygenase [Colwellia sp.]|nr:2OG-Fe(II) oxygenase [Colwellia sp.]